MVVFTTDRSKVVVLMLFVLCVALWLLTARLFMFCPDCCLTIMLWILSNTVILLLGKRELAVLLHYSFGLCTGYIGLFAFPLGVIGRLCSVIVALPRHLLHYFSQLMAKFGCPLKV